jgi:hypothetical protein
LTVQDQPALDISPSIRTLIGVLIAAGFAYCRGEHGSSEGPRPGGSIATRLANAQI